MFLLIKLKCIKNLILLKKKNYEKNLANLRL